MDRKTILQSFYIKTLMRVLKENNIYNHTCLYLLNKYVINIIEKENNETCMYPHIYMQRIINNDECVKQYIELVSDKVCEDIVNFFIKFGYKVNDKTKYKILNKIKEQQLYDFLEKTFNVKRDFLRTHMVNIFFRK